MMIWLFLEAGKTGCHLICNQGGGYLYILMRDMLLTDKLGTLYLPDGSIAPTHVSRIKE